MSNTILNCSSRRRFLELNASLRHVLSYHAAAESRRVPDTIVEHYLLKLRRFDPSRLLELNPKLDNSIRELVSMGTFTRRPQTHRHAPNAMWWLTAKLATPEHKSVLLVAFRHTMEWLPRSTRPFGSDSFEGLDEKKREKSALTHSQIDSSATLQYFAHTSCGWTQCTTQESAIKASGLSSIAIDLCMCVGANLWTVQSSLFNTLLCPPCFRVVESRTAGTGEFRNSRLHRLFRSWARACGCLFLQPSWQHLCNEILWGISPCRFIAISLTPRDLPRGRPWSDEKALLVPRAKRRQGDGCECGGN
jgi:hypothetical protein